MVIKQVWEFASYMFVGVTAGPKVFGLLGWSFPEHKSINRYWTDHVQISR